jgi:hypothetical protein
MEKVSEVYRNLYHYTTWEGLLGILKSRSLWATHYRFLNDFTEIILFRERLITLMLPFVSQAYYRLLKDSPHVQQKIDRKGGLRQVVHHDTEALVNAQYHAIGDEIYIVSFCGDHKNPYINRNGLLSQWRGYGAGGGVALVFNTEKLEEILSLEVDRHHYSALVFADLVYSDDDDRLRKEMSQDLTILADDVASIFDHQKTPTENTELKGYYSFANCISRYKHHSFREENEVRVAAFPTVLDKEIMEMAREDGAELKPEKERKFRAKEGGLIPYIDLFESLEMELPIERVIVGPHKEKESRAAALRIMLKKTGIEVLCSDIPFVG